MLTLQKDAARLQQQLQAATEASQTAASHVAEQLKQLDVDRQRLEEELSAFTPLVSPHVL
ncbi:Exonuclease SbcC [Pseudomonas amygdali pv. eriobotryae]|nr:Exonuclease SbcC [Pseudomonas amygdali pv. eriobotryae]